jgi:hypothetical protein
MLPSRPSLPAEFGMPKSSSTAAWRIAQGDERRAAHALREAVSGGRSGFYEHVAAGAQLHRLQDGRKTMRMEPLRWVEPSAENAARLFAAMTMEHVEQRANSTHLDLVEQGIGDSGARLLAASPRLALITRLTLEYNGISAAGAAALARSPYVGQIVELDLEDNPLGDRGLVEILHSERFASLRILKLSKTALTKAGLSALSANHHLAKLEQVYLGEEPIPIELWKQLAQRYGEGLFASGRFFAPYSAPFSSDCEIHISCAPRSAESWLGRALPWPEPESRPQVPATLHFLLSDHVAFRLESLAAETWRPRDRRVKVVVDNLAEMQRIEAGHLSPPAVTHIESSIGFEMLDRYLPIRLVCSACPSAYERPRLTLAFRAGAKHWLCPAGHSLT